MTKTEKILRQLDKAYASVNELKVSEISRSQKDVKTLLTFCSRLAAQGALKRTAKGIYAKTFDGSLLDGLRERRLSLWAAKARANAGPKRPQGGDAMEKYLRAVDRFYGTHPQDAPMKTTDLLPGSEGLRLNVEVARLRRAGVFERAGRGVYVKAKPYRGRDLVSLHREGKLPREDRKGG